MSCSSSACGSNSGATALAAGRAGALARAAATAGDFLAADAARKSDPLAAVGARAGVPSLSKVAVLGAVSARTGACFELLGTLVEEEPKRRGHAKR